MDDWGVPGVPGWAGHWLRWQPLDLPMRLNFTDRPSEASPPRSSLTHQLRRPRFSISHCSFPSPNPCLHTCKLTHLLSFSPEHLSRCLFHVTNYTPTIYPVNYRQSIFYQYIQPYLHLFGVSPPSPSRSLLFFAATRRISAAFLQPTPAARTYRMPRS